MRAPGPTINETVKAMSASQMAVSIWATIKTAKSMVKVCTLGPIMTPMMVSGLTARSMGTAFGKVIRVTRT